MPVRPFWARMAEPRSRAAEVATEAALFEIVARAPLARGGAEVSYAQPRGSLAEWQAAGWEAGVRQPSARVSEARGTLAPVREEPQRPDESNFFQMRPDGDPGLQTAAAAPPAAPAIAPIPAVRIQS